MDNGAAQLLGVVATLYGVGAAASALLQARQMVRRRSSCDVSARFFAAYAGGYAVWLAYGISIGSLPLVVVDAVGLLCGGLTLALALELRGSLLAPSTWSCPPSPVVAIDRRGFVAAGRTQP
jgi:uncharacterized protein with PQ loop repeat